MPSISITDLSVDLPVYGVDSRSLKKEVARADLIAEVRTIVEAAGGAA